MKRFQIVRDDGRSNTQVLLDLVKDGEPGQLYSFTELCNVFGTGTERQYTVADVRGIVALSTLRMLKEHQRRLHNIRGQGYRLAPAAAHMTLANNDRQRSNVQLNKGLHTLRNVRWDEMDANTRQAHEGHLMVTEALYANQIALDRRVRKIEDAIRKLK